MILTYVSIVSVVIAVVVCAWGLLTDTDEQESETPSQDCDVSQFCYTRKGISRKQ